MSRPKRWAKAVKAAQAAVADLLELQEEYENWLSGLPEGLDESPTAEKLEAVCWLEVAEIENLLQECEDAELPRGFGRD